VTVSIVLFTRTNVISNFVNRIVRTCASDEVNIFNLNSLCSLGVDFQKMVLKASFVEMRRVGSQFWTKNLTKESSTSFLAPTHLLLKLGGSDRVT
jgi:hypothetical protein